MLKVFIADDNEGMRLILRKAVEKAGHEIVGEAVNGAQAVDMVEELRPDVIFMDIEMPDVDGDGIIAFAVILILPDFMKELL